MKNKFSIIFSIILLIIGTSIIWIQNQQKTQQKSDIITMSWSNIRKDKLAKLSIENTIQGTDQFFCIENNQGTWTVIKPIDTNALQEKSLILINSFLTLIPSRVLSNISPEDFESYGFNNPTSIITLTLKDGKEYKLWIGNETSVAEQHYIRTEDTNTVYIIKSEKIIPFLEGTASVINNYVITENSDLIQKIQFHNLQGQQMDFEVSNGFWVQIKPKLNKTLDWGIRRFILQTKDLKVESKSMLFQINDSLLKKIGINTNTSPMLRVTFENGDVSELYIGNKKDSTYHYVYMASQKYVGWMNTAIMQIVFQTQEKDFEIKKPSN